MRNEEKAHGERRRTRGAVGGRSSRNCSCGGSGGFKEPDISVKGFSGE